MNTKVLTKCLEELSKESPNIEKVIGMLETIIEMSSSQPLPISVPQYPSFPMPTPIYAGTNATNVNIPIEEEGSGLLAAYSGGLPANIQ